MPRQASPAASCRSCQTLGLAAAAGVTIKLSIGTIVVAMLLGTTGCAYGLEGRIESGEYLSPENLFRVKVPVMRNPFIKEPATIRDERRPGGGVEVTFSVLELGEAWRFGARPPSAATPGTLAALGPICTSELERWTKAGKADLILEETTDTPDGTALGCIYHVEAASILFGSRGGSAPKRESALVGVMVLPMQKDTYVLYAVGQFDMPNRGGHYTLDTERGRKKLAEQQLQRLRELSVTLRRQ